MRSAVSGGRPVGSKAIASRPEVSWSPSTVRSELATLETEGYLTHPHTSAGRVPTDSGYRFYVGELLSSQDRLPDVRPTEFQLTRMRREVDDAIRQTTGALSRITDLVALVSAPPLATSDAECTPVSTLVWATSSAMMNARLETRKRWDESSTTSVTAIQPAKATAACPEGSPPRSGVPTRWWTWPGCTWPPGTYPPSVGNAPR